MGAAEAKRYNIANVLLFAIKSNKITLEVEKMSKTSNIYVRVEPEIKEEAEVVLGKLGIPMSNAVSMFLKQVVMRQGLPFQVAIPKSKPIYYEDLTEEEFNLEMMKAQEDFDNGRTCTIKDLEERLTELIDSVE